MASLRVISGPRAGATIEITDELLIGRDDSDLTLDDDAVSRRHAIVRRVGDFFEVEDLGSSNGTFVDGVRIDSPTRVGNGAKVTVGTTELVVEGVPVGATRSMSQPDPGATKPPVPLPLDAEPTQGRAVAPPAPTSEQPPAPRRRRLASRPLIAALALGAVIAIGLIGYFLTSGSVSTKASFVDVPIRFTVQDKNESLLKCEPGPTGRTYEISGRLVAPSEVGTSATLYLSGLIFSAMFEFHNKLVPGYDFVGEMAERGHTSVVIDRVGYGDTTPYPPDGRADCLGTHADIAHQVITAMRAGEYEIVGSDREPTAFERVALAGYSIGGLIGELETASFGDANALVVIGWAHQGFTPYTAGTAYVQEHCSPGSPKPPGGLRGYFHTLEPRKVPPLVSARADPTLVTAFAENQELDACGQLQGFGPWFAGGFNQKVIAQIKLPVLIMFGYYDVLFQFGAWQQEWDRFTGTRDRTLVGIPDGQMLMLDDHAAMTVSMLSAWLKRRGF